MASSALIDSDLSDLQLLSKGKVRDIYATSDPDLLLFVASDRISAYDVILKNVRPVSSIPLSALDGSSVFISAPHTASNRRSPHGYTRAHTRTRSHLCLAPPALRAARV